jgi:membrane fusion protein, heavy metal efflux system
MKSHIFVILASFILSCNSKTEKKQADKAPIAEFKLTQKQFENAKIKLGTISSVFLSEEIKSNGLIEVPPQNLASVSTPMAGYVKSTVVLPGSHVHKGDILAVLEHPDYIQLQQDYLMAKSKMDLLEKDFIRQKELQEEQVNSMKKYQTSESDYNIIKAQVLGLQEKLKLIGISISDLKNGKITSQIKIKSPLNGNVKSVNVSLGKFINPTDVMYEIVDISHLHLELHVFEKDILKINKGQKIYFTVPNAENKVYYGYVHLTGKTFDNSTKTVLVHGHLKNEGNTDLIPGMYVNATIEAGNLPYKALPESAVLMVDGKEYVFCKVSQVNGFMYFNRYEVKTGIKKEGMITINENPALLKCNQIVTDGSYFIQSEGNKGAQEE